VDAGADFPADTQSAESAQKCEGRVDDPAVLVQTASVLGAAPGDERADAQLTDLATVDVVVVTAVGVEDVGALTGSSPLAADGRYGVDQGQELGDVVAVGTVTVAARGYAVDVDNGVVLAARLAPGLSCATSCSTGSRPSPAPDAAVACTCDINDRL
jgi:hypothetical protein